MTENPVTIQFDFTVKEAAEVFLEKKISVAPVVDEGERSSASLSRMTYFEYRLR